MGIYNQGPFSGFSGKVGNLVGSSWRGLDVLKTRPRHRRNRKATPAQEEQQARFSLASTLTGYLGQLIKESYGKGDSKKANNLAYQEILDKVIGGTFPNLTIDYSKLPVAKGPINTAWNPAADSLETGKVKFTWTDNSLFQKASPNDNAILVLFCEEVSQLLYTTGGAQRSLLEDEMDVSILSGKEVHTWIAFLSPDQRKASDGVYTGLVTVL